MASQFLDVLPTGQVPVWAERGRCWSHTRKPCIKALIRSLIPCIVGAIVFSIFLATQSIHYGMHMRAAVPLMCTSVQCLLMIVANCFPRSVAPMMCFNSVVVACLMAWSMDEMVSLGMDTWQDSVSATIIHLKALGKVRFAEGHEESSHDALVRGVVGQSFVSEAVVALFLIANAVQIVAVIHYSLSLTCPHDVSTGAPVARPRITHWVLAMCPPILNTLVFMLTILLSSNPYQRWLWSFMLVLLMIAKSIRAAWGLKVQWVMVVQKNEMASRKAAQEHADSVLNHVLKNIMVDSSNGIEIILEEFPSELLSEVYDLLHRGIWWCRMRDAMLKVTSGTYKPVLDGVNLSDFARNLGRRRSKVSCTGPDEVVALDILLCNIVLDNAVSNAVRHSCPRDPQIQLQIKLLRDDASTGSNGPVRVEFCVTNRVKSEGKKVKRWTSDDPAPSPVHRPAASKSLSESIGLSQIAAAAKVGNMSAELWQEEDTVIFRAIMAAEVVTTESNGPSPQASEVAQPVVFPAGLRISCLDDSAIARRSLLHALSAKFPESTISVYGETVEEVEQFKETLLGAACDIALFDQNLDISGCSMLGTDILKDVLARGYRGLACIRSGNVSDADRELYMQSGAQCIFDKELPLKALAVELAQQHSRFEEQLETETILC